MKHKKLIGIATSALLIAALFYAVAGSASAQTPVNGAVRTTTNPSADGSGNCANGNEAVNCNIYSGKQYVWLSGEPLASSLSNGLYMFAVLVPGGQGGHQDPNDGTPNNLSDLGPTSNTGAGDTWTHRVFSIDNGTLTYPATGYLGGHDFDSNLIRLMPYDDTTNPGGVYILAVCNLADHDGTAVNQPGVNPSDCKYDAFKVQQANPVASPPVTTKDAAGSNNRTFTWGIQKDVDRTEIDQSNTGATFNYTVSVTHDAGTVSGVKVTGTITVFNPNLGAISGATISDKLSDGTVCAVTGGTNVTLQTGNNDFPYTCALSALPQGELDNTATTTWPAQNLSDGSLAAGTDSFTFSNISFAENAIDECVSVSDPADPNSPHNYCVGDAGDPTFSFTYSHTVTGTAGTCTSYDNTATFTTNDTSATGSDSKTVKLCVGGDLTVSKTAAPSFNRKYLWNVNKSVDKTTVSKNSGSATFNYTVVVNQTGFSDSAIQASGQITVTNPNDWESITPTGVTDAVDNGGNCSLTGGDSPTAAIPPLGTATFDYTCTYSSVPANGTNTATVTWDAAAAYTPKGSAHGTAAVQFGAPTSTTDKVITPTDTFNGGPATSLCVLDPTGPCTLTGVNNTPFTTHTYHYSRTISLPTSGCLSYTNMAATGTGPTSSKTVKVCRLLGGTFTMGYWQNSNGQAVIQAHASAWCTALKAYSSVLTGLPDCSGANIAGNNTKSGSLAKYVYDTVKSATSAGNGLPMLKAQFLAMALNVLNKSTIGATKVDLSGLLSSSELTTLGLSSCTTVNSLLSAVNSTLSSWSASKTFVTDVQSALNVGNQGDNGGGFLTC